jgi:hypothetical protein
MPTAPSLRRDGHRYNARWASGTASPSNRHGKRGFFTKRHHVCALRMTLRLDGGEELRTQGSTPPEASCLPAAAEGSSPTVTTRLPAARTVLGLRASRASVRTHGEDWIRYEQLMLLLGRSMAYLVSRIRRLTYVHLPN